MSKVSITRSLLDDLAMSISAKSGEAVPLTLTEMKDAVDSISGGGTTIDALSVTANGTYTAQSGHAYSPVTVNVPTSTPSLQSKTKTYTPTESPQTETISADSGYDGLSQVDVTVNAIQTETKSATPSETAQTITPTSGKYLTQVSVDAISNTYVGTGITRRSSSDLTASGATVTVPSGYYSEQASKAVASGTAGTPTATKGTVSNHSISVTPSVTNATGYITGGTKNGTAVTVSASELVSGTYTVSASGTHDVTNYASASVASGSATASATKGTVSNHSVTVTPSVTRTAGYITAGSANGTAVTVSASELVSGSETKTANGTYDVTNLASLVVDIDFVTYYTGTSDPASSLGSNGDIYLKVVS